MTVDLERGLKMFNQRLLAEHCLEASDAKNLWDEIRKLNYGMGGDTFEESIATSNEALKEAGLEIVGVSLRTQQGGRGNDQNKQASNNNRTALVRYYSIINRFPDDIAKNCFQSMFPPKQQAYVRLILEKLVELGPSTRATILNYKNIVNETSNRILSSQRQSMSQLTATQNSEENETQATFQKNAPLTLSVVEEILEHLLDDKWLVIHQADNGGSNRRTSNSSLIDIGPRSYLELSYLLVDEFGMEKDDLPQQIHHRK